MGFAAGYALWLPLQAGYTRLVAAAAAPILRLLDDPPLITSLVAGDERIAASCFLTGLDQPLVAWSTETLGVFVVAPLVLLLAAPVGRLRTRLCAASGVLGLVFALCVAIATTQIQIMLAAHLAAQPGIAVFGPDREAALARLNDALFVVGMLALPAFVFLVTYAVGSWLRSDGQPDPPRPWRAALLVPAGVATSALVAWGALAAVPPAPADRADYHEGWSRILELNPGFVPAQVNVALHLQAEGRLEQAVALYRAAARSRADVPEVHYNLGNALRELGRHEEAAESYRTVLRLAPGHAAAHRNLGLSLAELGRPCDAARHLEQSTRLDPSAAANARLLERIEQLEALCAPVP